MRWEAMGTTTGPTRIGDIVIPGGSKLLIPIAEPGDIEDCPSCQMEDYLAEYPDEIQRFRLHLEWHLMPQVRVEP